MSKKPCEPIRSDISGEKYLTETLNVKIPKYRCQWCDNIYARKDTLERHQKTCKAVKKDDPIDNSSNNNNDNNEDTDAQDEQTKLENLACMLNNFNTIVEECKKLETYYTEHKSAQVPNNEIVYLIKEQMFIDHNEPIYRIGFVISNEYPTNSEILCLLKVKNSIQFMRESVKTFKEHFERRPEYGGTYFEGDIDKMIDKFIEVRERVSNIIAG
jgi:hypothetical protein